MLFSTSNNSDSFINHSHSSLYFSFVRVCYLIAEKAGLPFFFPLFGGCPGRRCLTLQGPRTRKRSRRVYLKPRSQVFYHLSAAEEYSSVESRQVSPRVRITESRILPELAPIFNFRDFQLATLRPRARQVAPIRRVPELARKSR